MEAFKGKYERTAAENYDEMLKVIKIKFLTLSNCNLHSILRGEENKF